MEKYFNCHSHTTYSNIRLLDCINNPEDLVKKAIDLGLSGIAITDHECLSAAPELNQLAKQYPDFTIALGNEIYLCDSRESGQQYYHFILIAKDGIGHRALRELSSTAWFYSYMDRGMERVPTTKEELSNIMKRYKGHLIATTACIGGELGSNLQLYIKSQKVGDLMNAAIYYNNIDTFIKYCIDLFGDDFYIECAPSAYNEQVEVNKKLLAIAQTYNLKLVIGTDAHYLRKDDRMVHKAYLNSKDGEREVDDFYMYSYLMDSDEAREYLRLCYTDEIIDNIYLNSLEIQNKIQFFDLFHKQDVPSVQVKDYPKDSKNSEFMNVLGLPHLAEMFISDDIQNRYWINECFNGLARINKQDDKVYLDELEEESRVKSIISQKLETNMFRYPNTLQHYIDLMWDCGSIVAPGRGSSCAALNHYLMGITQLDPIEWEFPFFRYLNDERVELGCLILILPSCK